MAAYNPKYTVAIIHDSIKYDVTQAITGLDLQDNDGEIAQRATFTLTNTQVNGKNLSGIFTVRDRVFVYADDGEKSEEVFRGFVWERNYKSSAKKDLTLICYDNLIYFQESEEYQYFSSGYSTKSICSTLCQKWGVTLHYNYLSITHPKLPLRGNLADIFLTDLIEEVKKKTGKKGVMRSKQDAVHIDSVGSNETVYKIYSGPNGNAIDATSNITMQGMITKVVILGKEDDNDRAAVEATVNGKTDVYGTLQKILNTSTGTTLADAKAEAKELLAEKGTPKQTFSITAVNIPWIRKGDKIEVSAGDLTGYFIVTSITHHGDTKTMSMEAERAA